MRHSLLAVFIPRIFTIPDSLAAAGLPVGWWVLSESVPPFAAKGSDCKELAPASNFSVEGCKSAILVCV